MAKEDVNSGERVRLVLKEVADLLQPHMEDHQDQHPVIQINGAVLTMATIRMAYRWVHGLDKPYPSDKGK